MGLLIGSGVGFAVGEGDGGRVGALVVGFGVGALEVGLGVGFGVAYIK